jgi:hypothetical protein
MPGECRRRLDPCPNAAVHLPIADCQATARLLDQHNCLGAAHDSPRIRSLASTTPVRNGVHRFDLATQMGQSPEDAPPMTTRPRGSASRGQSRNRTRAPIIDQFKMPSAPYRRVGVRLAEEPVATERGSRDARHVAGGRESANPSPLRDVPPAGETQEAARPLANREEPPTQALANRVLGESAHPLAEVPCRPWKR